VPYKDPEKKAAYHKDYEKNKRKETEKRLAQRAEWMKDNRDQQLQNQRDWAARQSDEYRMWNRSKSRAKANDIKFEIEIEDVIIPEFCPYLGIKLEKGTGVKCDASPSLDRIVPALGYVKGNVEVISYLANVMKNSSTPEQLRTFCTNALKRL
jgi:hypothetical protein